MRGHYAGAQAVKEESRQKLTLGKAKHSKDGSHTWHGSALRREKKHLSPQTEGRALAEKHWVLAFDAWRKPGFEDERETAT